MENIVVGVQKQIDLANGRAGMQSAQNADLTEVVADMQYRQCLSELGLTPEDLMEGGTI
jgi:hypothetical protein